MSSLIVEPLLSFGPDGTLLPTLAAEVPTFANGGLSEDLTTVTVDLKEDVRWSDGKPFTADDVVWTWEWITDASNASVDLELWSSIQTVEAITPTQVQVIYPKPTLTWYAPIASAYFGGIIPAHVWRDGDREAVNRKFATEPIGTGPYKLEEFVQEKHILCTMNEQYREPNKPFFETVRFEGGGDAATDAQAVLQDGDSDVAGFLFFDPESLLPMETATGTGKLVAGLPTNVERIAFNFSDPNHEVDGERSSLQTEHPFLTDIRVRQAMSMAIDREAIAKVFLDTAMHPPATNILTGIAPLESANTSWVFDINVANDLLDQAGWVREGDTRTKDGIKLAVSYYTAAGEDSSLVKRFRPKIQALVKEWWEAIGIEVELGRLNGNDFFNVIPDNVYSNAHFYRDVQMWSNGPLSPYPLDYFADWYAGPDNSNVAQRSNDWLGWNLQRYVNPDFDGLYEEFQSTTDASRAVEIFIAMNDLIVNDFVVVPLVARPASIHAFANRMATDNIGISNWEPLYWNIANWRKAD